MRHSINYGDIIDEEIIFQDFRKIMQITESFKKDGFSSLDSDYRINPNVQGQFGNKQQSSSTDESSSTLKHTSDGNNAGDPSNKPIPGFTSPPPTSLPTQRSAPSKGNIRGNIFDKDYKVRSESLKKKR